ncbi:MAG: hypothetical protein QOK16_4107 [Solirubrobacteraceae bacterium]|jgi:hypothetical protein|nr:hypothetical protein [Solirubrobacteraceae bacterium]
MRTTVTIDDELLEAAKHRARLRGQTLGGLIEAALRRELALADEPPAAVEIPVFRGGTGPRPGVDLTSNRALYELLDEGLELDKRR